MFNNDVLSVSPLDATILSLATHAVDKIHIEMCQLHSLYQTYDSTCIFTILHYTAYY